MTLIETTKLLALIQGVYPRFADGRDLEVTKQAWALVFAGDDFAAVQKAFLAYVATDVKGFPPMPGALKSLMKPRVSEADAFLAWQEVRGALSNGLYGSREEFEKLSPLCRRLVGSPAVLREWAMMDVDRLDAVVGPGFQRSYRVLARDEAENSPSAAPLLDGEGACARLGWG